MKELLLLLANYPYRPSDKEALTRLLTGVTDWDFFVRLVNAHGIIALSAYNIKEAKLESLVPAKAMAMLENGLMQSVVRNSWLTERWKEMNKLLLDNGIKQILLKGMALEHTIYGAAGLRQMTDNDILIKKDEAMRAWTILHQNGFEPFEVKSRLHREIMFETGQHLPALIRDGYAVEIHTGQNLDLSDTGKTENDLFDHADEIRIGNEKAFKLKDDIHVRFLKDHLIRHAGAGECQLRSYADIMILEPGNEVTFPESFFMKPDQKNKATFRRKHYRTTVKSVTKGYRFRFIMGDIFPSLSWMRKRYRCGTLAALMRYPQRLGKLVWLV